MDARGNNDPEAVRDGTRPRSTAARVGRPVALVTGGLVAGAVLAGALGASAATGTSTSSMGTSTQSSSQSGAPAGGIGGSAPVRSDEKAVTGTTAATLQAAALKAVPGGTVVRIETDAGDGAYEVHMTKSDGSVVTVKFDQNLAVLRVESGMGQGDPAPAGAPSGTQSGGTSSSTTTPSST